MPATQALQRLLPPLEPACFGLLHWVLLYADRGKPAPQGPEHVLVLSAPSSLPALLGVASVVAAALHSLVSSCCATAWPPCPRTCSVLMASTAAFAAASAARLHPSKLDSKHQSPVKTRRPASAVTMPPPAGGSTWLVRQFKSFVFTGRGIFIPASSSSTPTIAAFAGPRPPPRLLASRCQSSVLD